LIREHVPEPYFSGFLRISTPNDFSLDALIDFLNGDLCITYQASNGRHIKINRQDSRAFKETHQYQLPGNRNHFMIHGRTAYQVETLPDDDLEILNQLFDPARCLIFKVYASPEEGQDF